MAYRLEFLPEVVKAEANRALHLIEAPGLCAELSKSLLNTLFAAAGVQANPLRLASRLSFDFNWDLHAHSLHDHTEGLTIEAALKLGAHLAHVTNSLRSPTEPRQSIVDRYQITVISIIKSDFIWVE